MITVITVIIIECTGTQTVIICDIFSNPYEYKPITYHRIKTIKQDTLYWGKNDRPNLPYTVNKHNNKTQSKQIYYHIHHV